MYLDAHAHLDKYDDAVLDSVIETIEELEILTLAASMDVESFERTESIATRSDRIVGCFGIHPWEAPRYAAALDELAPIAARTPIIGEVGLDHRFVTDEAEYGPQREVFSFFLEAAGEQRKIVNLHCVGAEHETADLLHAHDAERVIVHWYSGPLKVMPRLLDLGCLFTVGVEVLHSDHIRRIAAAVPDDRLLTETDNPGGARWLTGEPGTPELIVDVVEEVAAIRRVERDELVATVAANAARLTDGDRHLVRWRALLDG